MISFILPYHETQLFGRVVQLFNSKSSDKWDWLKSCQKSGQGIRYKGARTHEYVIKVKIGLVVAKMSVSENNIRGEYVEVKLAH